MCGMKHVFKLILSYPKLILAIMFGLALLGLRTAESLPMDVFPDIHVPRVVIQTEAGGLTAEEVEQRVTLPIEAAVNGVPGVSTIRSSSSGGLSFVWVDFDWATDIARARFDVFERLSRVRETLPAEADPELAPIVSVTGEIMLLALTAPSNTVSATELRESAEFDLRNRLLSVPGIGEVVAIGGRLPEYRIEVNPRRLAANGVSVNDVIAAAQDSRTYSSAGYLAHVAGEEIPLRQIARADGIEALKRLPVAPGESLRLGDVADVTLAGAPRRGSASFNGQDAVVLSVQKAPGGNTPELTAQLDKVLDAYEAEVKSKGIEIHRTAYRQDDFIGLSVKGSKDVLRDAVIIVVIVLGLTLLSFRTLAIVLVSIPLSVLLGVLCFPAFDLGVNVMTLGGFAVAAGDIVDAAIIFTEVIWRRLGENSALPPALRKSRQAVILEAASSVLPSVLFSTAIIVLVFIPLLMLSGLEGRFFRPLGLAFLIVFSMSFIAAVTIVPSLASLLWKDPKKARGSAGESAATRALKAAYRPMVRLTLKFPRTIVFLAIAMCAAAFWMATSFGSSFLPPFHEGSFNVSLSLPPGSSLDETERVSESCISAIKSIDGVLDVTRRTGRAERDQHAEPVSSSEFLVRLDASADSNRIRDEIRAILGSIPGTSHLVGYPIAHRISAILSGTESEIAINIYGEDPERLRAAVADVKKALATVKGAADVRANREVMVKTYRIDYDIDLLSEAGLTLKDAGEQVSAAFYGVEAGEVRNGLSRRSVTVRLSGIDKNAGPDAVKSLILSGKTGRHVRLDEVARVVPEMASNLLLREGGRRKALISCNPAANENTGDLIAALGEKLDPVAKRYGCSIDYDGSYKARESAARRLSVLGVALLAAIGLLVFAALRDLRSTALALVNIPLGLVGGIAAVAIAHPVLSVSSLVGFITVTGFTLRNGLLLLNRYGERMDAGDSLERAIEDGSSERMVPILMTSLTTVIGLVPIIMAGNKPGGELLAPLALVQFGGILGATFLNLAVLPAAAKIVLTGGRSRSAGIAATAVAMIGLSFASGCKTYEASPVDWRHEASAWTSATGSVHLASADDAALLARIGNAELNAMRLKCRNSKAIAAETGWWNDPSLDIDLNRIVQSSENPFLGGASLSFAIPLSGAPAFDAKAAELYAEADALAAVAAENDVAADARAAFHKLKSAQSREKAIRRFLDGPRLKAMAETMKRLSRAGEASAADIAAFDRRVHARRHQLSETVAEGNAAESELRRLLGLAPNVAIALGDDDVNALPAADMMALAGMPPIMEFTKHPKVRERMARLEGGEAALRAEIRRQYPDLKFGPAYSREEGTDRLGIVAGIDIPIWNRNRKAIAEATAERDETRDGAIQAWRETVLNAAAARQDIVRLLKHDAPKAVDEETIVKLYQAGEIDGQTLLAYIEDVLDAQLAEIEFNMELAAAIDELKRTL